MSNPFRGPATRRVIGVKISCFPDLPYWHGILPRSDSRKEELDQLNAYNIRVINLSLGRPVFESYKLDPLCQAVEAAWKAGIVVVVAAGNSGRDNSQGTNGYATITSPGNDPYVITVGAMKTMGTPTRKD